MVELKKTLHQKRKAWAAITTSKKVKFVDAGSKDTPTS